MDYDVHMIQLGKVLRLFLTMYQKHSTLAHWRVKDSFKLERSFLVIQLADVIDSISMKRQSFGDGGQSILKVNKSVTKNWNF